MKLVIELDSRIDKIDLNTVKYLSKLFGVQESEIQKSKSPKVQKSKSPQKVDVKVNRDDVRRALNSVAQKHGRKAGIDVLSKFNVKNTHELEENDYIGVIDACDIVLGDTEF